mmetsp:Transcript_53011/g.79099  ORF Transcript_53011/g.79099 Transcript_53011/m.79099 type:complete len:80 (+) Transcript_53011:479-718(+)
MTNIDDKPSQIRKQRNDLLLFFKFAVHEGLIKEEGANYRFSHDHIQFAAYSLIPEDEKNPLAPTDRAKCLGKCFRERKR